MGVFDSDPCWSSRLFVHCVAVMENIVEFPFDVIQHILAQEASPTFAGRFLLLSKSYHDDVSCLTEFWPLYGNQAAIAFFQAAAQRRLWTVFGASCHASHPNLPKLSSSKRNLQQTRSNGAS